jgi:hypothetical protein
MRAQQRAEPDIADSFESDGRITLQKITSRFRLVTLSFCSPSKATQLLPRGVACEDQIELDALHHANGLI